MMSNPRDRAKVRRCALCLSVSCRAKCCDHAPQVAYREDLERLCVV